MGQEFVDITVGLSAEECGIVKQKKRNYGECCKGCYYYKRISFRTVEKCCHYALIENKLRPCSTNESKSCSSKLLLPDDRAEYKTNEYIRRSFK